MRWNTFARSSLFAAVAAAAWVPWVFVAGPIVGVWTARALYLGGVMMLYTAGLSPGATRGVVVALVAGAAASCVALAAQTTAELAIGLAMILGVARSGFLYRAAPARAVTTELALLVGGLLFAGFLAGYSLLSTGLGLWGFLLVQSLFFLVAGVQSRAVGDWRVDPFEEALRRALALLERGPA